MDDTNKENKLIKYIYNNKYNKLIFNGKEVTILKTKKYKKKDVIIVKMMSIEKYKMMLIYPEKKTYLKTQKKL